MTVCLQIKFKHSCKPKIFQIEPRNLTEKHSSLHVCVMFVSCFSLQRSVKAMAYCDFSTLFTNSSGVAEHLAASYEHKQVAGFVG
jgi:hypothetical protein